MTFWEGLALASFAVTVLGAILCRIGGGQPALPPPPRPDEGPSGEALIYGPEAEVLWFEYQRRLDEWQRSGGPKPRLRLAATIATTVGLIGLGVSLTVIIIF